MFQTKVFMVRYYVLNPANSTLTVSEGPSDIIHDTIFELRRNRLVHVDTNLRRRLPPDYKRFFPKGKISDKVTLPDEMTEPIGLTFSDASVMLLWARKGKDYKIWTRAFKRFVTLDERQKVDRTTWWMNLKDHSFVLAVYRSLVKPVELLTEFVESEENKTVEGWLCKTAPTLPVEEAGSPFLKGLKTFVILDLVKLQLILHSKTDGKATEKFNLNERLCAIDTEILGQLDNGRI